MARFRREVLPKIHTLEAHLKISQKAKGRVRSEESIRKMARTLKRGYASGIYVAHFKGKHLPLSTRLKISASEKGKKLSEATKQRMSRGRKRWFRDPKNMERFCKEILPKVNTIEAHRKTGMKLKGRSMSEQAVQRMIETKKRLYRQGKIVPWDKGIKRPDIAELMRKRNPMQNPESRKKAQIGFSGGKHTAKAKAAISKKSKQLWKNKEYRGRVLKSVFQRLRRRPTSFERRVIHLIKKHQLPFRYVGDGRLFISGKNPDFIGTNGKKMIIESFWTRIHRYDYVQVRRRFFKKLGYSILFLNEDDLYREDWHNHCLGKIETLLNSS